jgi:hypothetical protein
VDFAFAAIVASDEFDRQDGEPLPLAWKWIHNPHDRYCMKDGDCAGVIALQRRHGFAGVKMEGESQFTV